MGHHIYNHYQSLWQFGTTSRPLAYEVRVLSGYRYGCMKPTQTSSTRGGSARQVHQKKIDTVYNVHHGVSIWFGRRAEIQFSSDGDDIGNRPTG